MLRHQRAGTSSVLRLALVWSVQIAFLASAAISQSAAATPAATPGAPHPPLPGRQQANTAVIIGTVTGTRGEVLQGATATLTDIATGAKQTKTSDSNGFLSFSVPPGQYSLTVTSPGFISWSSGTLTLAAGDYRELSNMVLKMSTAVDTVRVTASEKELATIQVKREEQQRIFGVIPNYYVTYARHPAPLSVGQKFQLAWKDSIAPFTFAATAADAGAEQASNTFPGYGSGVEGYAKRYAAAYADDLSGSMLGGVVFPALLRQDPRYYYLGKGSVMFRTMYALGTIFICKGNNGRWQPNYSFVLGNFAAGAVSSLYYPEGSGGPAKITLDNGLAGIALQAVNNLAEEFVLRRLTTHARKKRK